MDNMYHIQQQQFAQQFNVQPNDQYMEWENKFKKESEKLAEYYREREVKALNKIYKFIEKNESKKKWKTSQEYSKIIPNMKKGDCYTSKRIFPESNGSFMTAKIQNIQNDKLLVEVSMENKKSYTIEVPHVGNKNGNLKINGFAFSKIPSVFMKK